MFLLIHICVEKIKNQMTLLTKTPEVLSDYTSEETVQSSSDTLSIQMETNFVQPSAMPEGLKKQRQENAPQLYDLLTATLKEKGEYPLSKTTWINDQEIKVEGLSKMTLHSFIMKAEQLGKKIKYRRSLVVEITD